MARQLTVKQKKLADLWMNNGNGTQAALAVYDTTDYQSAAALASRELKKDKVRAYIIGAARIAAQNVFELANGAQNEAVKLAANKDILDRGGLKGIEESRSVVEHVYSGSIRVDNLAEKVAEELASKKLLE